MASRAGTHPSTVDTSMPQRLLDVLFPPRCVHCETPGALLCAACRAKIAAPPGPRCEHCDLPLYARGGTRCAMCVRLVTQGQTSAVDRIVVASIYEGPLGSAIRALKFRRQRRLAAPLGSLLIDAARRVGLAVDVIIPMPLHAGRRRERGYNQASLLARPLARTLGVPLREDLLIRSRATQPQTRLTVSQRHANVSDAFALTALAATALAGKRIALVDDVTTTGATLDAAAHALRAARPAAIYALAVARPARAPSDLLEPVERMEQS